MKSALFTFIFASIVAGMLSFSPAFSREITQSQIPLASPKVVNFQKLAEYELVHPVKQKARLVEQGEDREEEFKFVPQPIPAGAISNNIQANGKAQGGNSVQSISPSPTVNVNGIMDNGTLIPPDIRGAAGANYLMQTTNQQFKIFNKSGGAVSTVSISTLFSSAAGKSYFDPHIVYDATNSRFIIAIDGTLQSNNHMAIFVAVSQTNDPTGNWYIYSFDATGNSTDFLDYPLLGFNTNWIVVSANDFLTAGGVAAKIYTFNRASLYSGTSGTVNVFSDGNGFCLAPAETNDNTQTTEYLVQDWNGNSGANGYVQTCTITGTASNPVFAVGNTIGVNQPWSETQVNAPQSGNSNKLEAGDTRIGNAVYTNGALWFCHTVFLPAASPTHAAVDWWQLNPATSAIKQFGRIEDATASNFYFYPSININNAGDALLGYCQSSSSTFASAAYSFHASSDPVSTMQGTNIYKAGLASYYKTFSGSRNRWGDYTATAVDPTDGSFWNFSEYANTSNMWATSIARVAASASGPACNQPTALTTTNIANTTATISWTAASGATSYNIQYRKVGTTTWSTATTATASYNASGLVAATNYEWQVQTTCSSGISTFTSSANFTTTGTVACSIPTGLNTSNIGATSATFSWTAVTGAVSYNLQYRPMGTSTWSTANVSSTSYNASSLVPGTYYEWQLQTVCSTGSSAFSGSATFTTPALPCSIAAGLVTSAITTTSATLSWTAVSGAVSYNIQYRKTGTTTWTSANTTVATYSATALSSTTAYEWQVQTVCSTGSSAFTGSATFTTLAPPCTIATGLSTTNVTASTATFSWIAVSGAVSYNVQYRKTGVIAWSTANTSSTSYSATGLSSGTSYEWQIQTVCSSGSSSFSASANFTTLLVASCGIPTGLNATSITNSTANLSWSPVSGAISYNVQWRVSTSSLWLMIPGVTSTSFSINSLLSCTGYQYQVQTVCSSGTSAWSTAGTFTTAGCSVVYCASKGGSTAYEYINNVKLGTINNTSGDNGGYADFTAMSTALTGGSSNTITLTPGFHGYAYDEYWAVYIDYNHNGSLSDAGELVAQGHATMAVNLPFTVPTTALNGATRMRVIMEYYFYQTNPCSGYTYGETEDYTVNITGNSNLIIPSITPVEEIAGNETTFSNTPITLFPNPAQDHLGIEFGSAENGAIKMSVYNMSGQRVITDDIAAAEGMNKASINTTSLTTGVYIFEIENAGNVKRQRFSILK